MENSSNLSSDIKNNLWKPDVIVLGPGGAKGYLELGLLLAFEKENYYDNVSIWIGCSIGSTIALLIVSGYSVVEILSDCIDINIINDVTDINIDHLTDNPGLLTVKSVENLIKKRIIQKFGFIPTLKQLYMATGINLVLVTFNYDKYRPEYLSKDTEPNLSCVEAVMMSAAIPGLICPRVYRGNTYIDGAIGDPYPILVYDDGDKNVLGIYIDSEETVSPKKSFGRYLYRCAQATMKVLRDRSISESSDNCKHIALKTSVMDTTGLSFENKDKKLMIESGYKTGILFLKGSSDPEYKNLILEEDGEFPFIEDINTTEANNLENSLVGNSLIGNSYINNYNENDPENDLENENSTSEEDLYVLDLLESDEDTLFIPITPELQKNIDNFLKEKI